LNEYNKNIIETIIATLFMNLYALLSINYTPLLLVLYPLVFIVLGIRDGVKYSIISMIMVSTSIALTGDVISSIILLTVFGPMTVYIIIGIKNRRKSLEIIAVSAVLFFSGLIALYGYSEKSSGINIKDQMEENFQILIENQMETFKDMNLTNTEILNSIDNLESTYKIMVTMLPAALILVSVAISYLNYLMSSLVLRRTGIGVVNVPLFSRFKLPNNYLYGALTIFATLFILKRANMSNIDAVNINAMILIYFMIIIQGLAVLDFMLKKFKFQLVPRIILIITITFIGPLTIIISLVGIMDLIFDFRKLKLERS